MEYTTLGSTGLSVSRLCLGCYGFGGEDDWKLDAAESTRIIERAIDLGITFFDTANMYGWGESERILGSALADHDRDRLVVATKGYVQMDDGNPNSGGLSRKAIEQELANSLDRLGMETVDLYNVHRWDYETPIEETVRALGDAIRRGRTRYVGASSMWAHQFAEAVHTCERLNVDRFVAMQTHYNLTYREEERETLPFCEREGIGVTAWSPLARGFLARPAEEYTTTSRGRFEREQAEEREYLEDHVAVYEAGGGREINRRVEELAADRGVTMAQISLAWLLHQDWVDAPVVGTTSLQHLEEAVEALDIDLSDGDLEYLVEPYRPVPVTGHD